MWHPFLSLSPVDIEEQRTQGCRGWEGFVVVLVFGYDEHQYFRRLHPRNRPDADNGQELLVGERVASVTAYLRVEG